MVLRCGLWGGGFAVVHSVVRRVILFSVTASHRILIPHHLDSRFINPHRLFAATATEPGYYHDHHFGIRIENVLLIKEVATTNCFGDKPYLGFEHVTVAPIGKNLMNVNMLSPKEKQWVNRYHEKCWLLLNDRVGDLGREWLRRETTKI